VLPLRFVMFDDDQVQVGEVKMARDVPRVGEGMTFESVATGEPMRRFRVHDVDRGYVQTTPRQATYKESTVVVYLIDANDPRRDFPL
jgi:hypothetical protein